MQLEVTRRAQRDIERLGRWWLEHRDKAPRLFEEELAAAFRLITEAPGSGQTYMSSRGHRVLRVLMPITKNHVYYCQHADVIRVVAVWGAVRGRGPRV